MPLFKNNNERGDDEQGNHGEQAPPDEHTRLLPNRVDSSRGMLRPGDPAISPYNLWSIRLLRFMTVLFTMITFVWWLIMLASMFATPPGFHTRGSGFFAYSFASLALANMLFTLIFFGAPSMAVRILAVMMAVGAQIQVLKARC